MVPLEVAPDHNAAQAQGLERETSRIASHPSAGPSSGVEHASSARPGRGGNMPEVYDMAVGDSEHLRHVGGNDPIGWTHPA
eukprot:1832858-Alexandrium_andersonii.AAC.1